MLTIGYWLFGEPQPISLTICYHFGEDPIPSCSCCGIKNKKKIETFLIRNNDYDQVIDVNRITQTFITQIERSAFFFLGRKMGYYFLNNVKDTNYFTKHFTNCWCGDRILVIKKW